MAVTLHGIPNCDTVQRARAWLAAQGIDVAFHDFRKSGVPPDAASARPLMLAQPSLIRRPIVAWGSDLTVGFDPDRWAARLSAGRPPSA